MSETTITRRSVLTTGTLSAIGIGLMAAAGTRPEPVAAGPLPTPAVRVVNYPELTAEVRATVAALDATVAKERAASDALEVRLGRELYMEVMRFVEGPYSDMHDAWEDLMLAELERHLPGVAPVLYMVRQHIYEAK